MTDQVLIIDMLARGPGKRLSTIDVLGAGPRTIAGVLEKHGLTSRVVPGELFFENPRVSRGYSSLFISGMSSDLKGAARAIRLWRRHSRGVVVAGGPMAQDAERMLELGADLVVVGEAEATLDELLSTGFPQEKLDPEELEGVRGIAFRERGKVTYTGPRPRLSGEELSHYWASTQVIKDYPGYWFMRVYVEVVRGCSNVRVPGPPAPGVSVRPRPGCAYCSVVALWGPSRSMGVERVVREVRGLVEAGVRRIVLSGPDILDYGRERFFPTGWATDPEEPPPNLDALESLFKELYRIPEVASGEVVLMAENTKPTTVTPEAARLLGYYLEGTPIHMGLETGDERLLEAMARPGDLRTALRAVRLLRENGLRPYVYLIYGLPGQDGESMRKTLGLVGELEKLGVEKITLYRFTPLPSTAYEDLEPGDPNDPWNKALIERVRDFNKRAKEGLVGARLNVLIVGKRGRNLLAYPLKHGPVIVLEPPRHPRGRNPLGRRAKVVVTEIEGDRIVRGRVVKLGRRVYKPSRWEVMGLEGGIGGRSMEARRFQRRGLATGL